MGCFNIMGFHTHLPIEYGDEIVLLLGVYPKYKKGEIRDFCRFAPGFEFTPIALPIFGKYNDYGTIEDIERDLNVEMIEKFFNMKIDELIRLVDDEVIANRYVSEEKHEQYKGLVEKIWNLQSDFIINSEFEMVYDLTFTIDHRFVYDTIKNLWSFPYNIEKSIDAIMELCPPWENVKIKYNDIDLGEIETKLKAGEITEYEYELTKARASYFGPYDHWLNYLNQGYGWCSKERLINVIPKKGVFEHTFWGTRDGFDESSIFAVYSSNEGLKVLFTTLRTAFIDYTKFLTEFCTHQWCFDYHVYGTQQTHCTTALPYYHKMAEMCEKIAKRELEFENDEYEDEDYEQ